MNPFVETCCASPEHVRSAVLAGTGRIELCRDLDVGGLTPPEEQIRAALEFAGSIPVNVLVRPRKGDFVYSEEEIPQIVTDYISGMTDQYAIRRYMDLFIPMPLAEHANDDALLKKAREQK